MYVFFEYLTLLALLVLIATLLFAASVVFVMVDERIATIRQIAPKTRLRGTSQIAYNLVAPDRMALGAKAFEHALSVNLVERKKSR
jgi:type III secretory pathway component EscR